MCETLHPAALVDDVHIDPKLPNNVSRAALDDSD